MPRQPFTRSLRVGGTDQSKRSKSIDIFFPFDDQNPVARSSLQNRRQVVQNPLHALHIPNPAPFAIGPPLPKRLGLETNNLISQCAIGAAVVVAAHDTRPALDGFPTWKQISHAAAD